MPDAPLVQAGMPRRGNRAMTKAAGARVEAGAEPGAQPGAAHALFTPPAPAKGEDERKTKGRRKEDAGKTGKIREIRPVNPDSGQIIRIASLSTAST